MSLTRERLEWIGILLGMLVAAWAVMSSFGCIAEGHRRVEVEFFGQRIVVDDQVYPDSTGEQKFKSGFDDESSFMQALIGWMFAKPEPADETAKPEEETTVEPG